ncbi:MAG: ABC transporter substrate-binding protein [Dehalococcoidia bacterium]|nr:ABC transporter substrate-binding protein [Dehalococcoidia bacterium]
MKMHCRIVTLILAVTMIGSLLLTACTSSSPTALPSEGPAASSKPYGSLAVGTDFRTDNADPIRTSGSTIAAIFSEVYDMLVYRSADGQIKPGIAERWEIAPDGMTQTFYIRKGVKFHDGSDLTGADVKFSVDRLIAPDSSHNDAGSWRAALASVDLKDDYTVVFRMKSPQFDFITGFADLGGTSAVLPKKYIEEKGVDYFRKNPVGSGPFKVVKYEPAVRLEIEAVDSHWRKVPQFKNITLLNIREVATTVAMLKTGELDLAEVMPDDAASLKAAGLRIQPHDGAVQGFMIAAWDKANPTKYALGNVKVRKAISLAVNRREMADDLFKGYADPGILAYGRPTAGYWDSNQLKPDPYDPEGAKKLLAEAGYPNGFNLTLWDSKLGGNSTQLATAVGGYLRKVGLEANVVAVEWTVLTAKYNPKQLPDIWDTMVVAFLSGAFWDFEKMGRAYDSKRTPGTYSSVNNPKLDELIEKAEITLDPAQKKEIQLQAAILAKNEYNVIDLVEVKTVFALSSRIGSFAPIAGMAALGPALESITHAK